MTGENESHQYVEYCMVNILTFPVQLFLKAETDLILKHRTNFVHYFFTHSGTTFHALTSKKIFNIMYP